MIAAKLTETAGRLVGAVVVETGGRGLPDLRRRRRYPDGGQRISRQGRPATGVRVMNLGFRG